MELKINTEQPLNSNGVVQLIRVGYSNDINGLMPDANNWHFNIYLQGKCNILVLKAIKYI